MSGGIFDPKKRPGLAALMTAAKMKPRPFDVLVMMNQSRLGRRSDWVADTVRDLYHAGIRIFWYQSGQELKYDTATDRFMVNVTGFTDESYREASQITTRETMKMKALRGDVVGNVIYGYVNYCTACQAPTTPHRTCTCKATIHRTINEDHAVILRRLFQMIADGRGLVKCAKTFNAEGITPPRSTWSASAIRAILFNELYRGVIVYGRTKWVDQLGDRKKVRVLDPTQWIRVEKPELRIIPEDLWQAAHTRLARTKAAYLRSTNGRVWGRPETGLVSPYLLTGVSECAIYHSSLFVRARPDGRDRSKAPYRYYACSYHHLRGDSACSNGLAMQMTAADESVLAVLKRDILNPEALAQAIEMTIERYGTKPRDLAAQRKSLDRDLARLAKEIDVLYGHLASGLAGVKDQILDRERKQSDLKAHLARLDVIAALPTVDTAGLTKELRARIDEWRNLLDGEPAIARQIVRKLIDGRIAFTPGAHRGVYTFSGNAAYGRLLAGTVLQSRVCPRQGLWPRHDILRTLPPVQISGQLTRAARPRGVVRVPRRNKKRGRTRA